MIDSRLTRMFGLTHPVFLAPVPGLADGRLAGAVSRAGGLGFFSAAGHDSKSIREPFSRTGKYSVGCGFDVAQLAEQPDLLSAALGHYPRAIYLYGGDPRPFSDTIHAARRPLVCQVRTMADAGRSVAAGASIIVAHGSEGRSTLSLVPEVASYLHKADHDILLLASGGIADGRGLAAMIIMGADGVVLGSRLFLSEESPIAPTAMSAALSASGDDLPLASAGALGQSIGLVQDAPCVEDILNRMSRRAASLLVQGARKIIP